MADVQVQFEPDMRGIREILHSDGVNAELQGVLDDMTADANGQFYEHFPTAYLDGYMSAIDDGRFTSLGVVFTYSKLGRIDEAKYHTLEGLNH